VGKWLVKRSPKKEVKNKRARREEQEETVQLLCAIQEIFCTRAMFIRLLLSLLFPNIFFFRVRVFFRVLKSHTDMTERCQYRRDQSLESRLSVTSRELKPGKETFSTKEREEASLSCLSALVSLVLFACITWSLISPASLSCSDLYSNFTHTE
jgi:hypothetical protein